ncbi:MAG: hypothetical protein ACRD68_11435 [Pyrinomonadaceae bacterium]
MADYQTAEELRDILIAAGAPEGELGAEWLDSNARYGGEPAHYHTLVHGERGWLLAVVDKSLYDVRFVNETKSRVIVLICPKEQGHATN